MIKLNGNIREICASATVEQTLEDPKFLAAWQSDIQAEEALTSYVSSDDSFNLFLRIKKRMMILFEKLYQEKWNRLSTKGEVGPPFI